MPPATVNLSLASDPGVRSHPKKLIQVPHKPGVYLRKDRCGTVSYVGKSRDLRKRVVQYFRPSRRMGWDLGFNALGPTTPA